MRTVDTEQSIRQIVKSSVQAYASGFEARHLGQVNDPNGVINMKTQCLYCGIGGRDTILHGFSALF